MDKFRGGWKCNSGSWEMARACMDAWQNNYDAGGQKTAEADNYDFMRHAKTKNRVCECA